MDQAVKTPASHMAPINADQLPLDAIRPSTTAVQTLRRTRYSAEGLLELATTIKEVGVLEPILVRTIKPVGAIKYEIAAGERRWLASKRAGLAHVPAIIRELTDAQVLRLQLIENLQRDDLRPLEEAAGYRELMTADKLNLDQMGGIVGKSRSWVNARLRLLDLPTAAKEALQSGAIDPSRALIVARVRDPKRQEQALKLAGERNYSGEFSYSVRRLREELEKSKILISLKNAPFSPDDATLKPMACIGCLFRSGNCSDAPDEDPDVCTSPDCFQEKVKQHTARLLQKAKADGKEVIEGDKAKKIAPRAGKLVGFVDLDEGCDYDQFPEEEPQPAKGEDDDSPTFQLRLSEWERKHDAWRGRTYRQLLADAGAKLEPTLIKDPKTKRVRELVPLKEVRAILSKKHDIAIPSWVGKAEQTQSYTPPSPADAERRRKEEAAQLERQEQETEFRKRVIKAISEKAAGPLKREELVDIADALIEDYDTEEGLSTIYDDKVPEPGDLKDADLLRFIRVALLAETMDSYGAPKALIEAAKRHKINVEKIRATIKAEAKVEAAAKKAAEKADDDKIDGAPKRAAKAARKK